MDGKSDVGHMLTNNGLFLALVTGLATLATLLILGSYTYTWSESGRIENEKVTWREQHEKTLDIRFSELKQGQDKLAEAVSKNNDTMKDILIKILDEQRKANQSNKLRRD